MPKTKMLRLANCPLAVYQEFQRAVRAAAKKARPNEVVTDTWALVYLLRRERDLAVAVAQGQATAWENRGRWRKRVTRAFHVPAGLHAQVAELAARRSMPASSVPTFFLISLAGDLEGTVAAALEAERGG